MSAQGSSEARTLGLKPEILTTLKGLGMCDITLSGLNKILRCFPWVVASLQPRAEISERLRRNV